MSHSELKSILMNVITDEQLFHCDRESGKGEKWDSGFMAGMAHLKDNIIPQVLETMTPPPCPACEAAAQERDDLHSLCDRQSGILSRVAVALRGPEPPQTRWGHHDLPERAERAIQERDEAYEDARMMQARLQRLIDAEPQRDAELRARLEAKAASFNQTASDVRADPDLNASDSNVVMTYIESIAKFFDTAADELRDMLRSK